MFDVQFDVIVDFSPPEAVAKPLSHLYDTGVAFVCKLKNVLA